MKPYGRMLATHPQETTLTSEVENLSSWGGVACGCLPLSLVSAYLCNTKSGILIQTMGFELHLPGFPTFPENESRRPRIPWSSLTEQGDFPEQKTDNSGLPHQKSQSLLVFITLKVVKQVQNNLVIRIVDPSIKKEKPLLYEAIHTWLKFTSCDRIKRQFEMGGLLFSSEKPNQ